MAKCGQACPYNTLDGCKVKEYSAICPLTNMATPIAECKMTNADRIRAMSDEELTKLLSTPCPLLRRDDDKGCPNPKPCRECIADWLKQPAE